MAEQVREARSKHLHRPRKGASDKRRRQKVQRRRLVALGVPEETVLKMDPQKVRLLLRRPLRVAKKLGLKK
jgi:hypothetical protein